MARHPEIYRTSKWLRARDAVLSRSFGLCEICQANGDVNPATTIHHKIHLTDDNKHNLDIAYGLDNLQAVCREHHEELHGRNPEEIVREGLMFNEYGELVENKSVSPPIKK